MCTKFSDQLQAYTVLLLILLIAISPPKAHAQDDGGTLPRLEQGAVISTDGYRLPLSTWLPDNETCRVVLALHGFNDFRKTFRDLATALSADCTAFYAYDQRGFGGTKTRTYWPGWTRLVNDAELVLKLLHKRYPETPLYLFGESMGGAVAILALTQDTPLPVDGVILSAPAVWARELQPWYQRLGQWLGVRFFPDMKLSSEWIGIDPSDDPEVLEYWRSHPMVIQKTRISALYGVSGLMDAALPAASRLDTPALILYGGEDEVIPPEATCALLRELEQAPAEWRFVYYPEGYHMLTRYSGANVTIGDIRTWLESPRALLPSGRELGQVRALEELCE